MLAVCEQVTGQAAPPAWLLGIRGEEFELGMPMSAEAAARLGAATQFARELLSNPDAAYWDRALQGSPCTN